MITDLKTRIDALAKTNPWLAIRLLWAEIERLRAESEMSVLEAIIRPLPNSTAPPTPNADSVPCQIARKIRRPPAVCPRTGANSVPRRNARKILRGTLAVPVIRPRTKITNLRIPSPLEKANSVPGRNAKSVPGRKTRNSHGISNLRFCPSGDGMRRKMRRNYRDGMGWRGGFCGRGTLASRRRKCRVAVPGGYGVPPAKT